MANILAEAKSVIQATPGHELLEKYGPLLRTGIDKAFKRKARMPVQGQKFFMESTESKGYKKFQGKVGTGLMKKGRDNQPPNKSEGGLGFDYEISTALYYNAISIERALLEKEQYGLIGNEQRELADSSKRTIELLCADIFNRGFGGVPYGIPYDPNGHAPFICEDGAYFISTDRHNPAAESWSNRLPNIEFTPGGNNDQIVSDMIRDVKLAGRLYKNDDGIKSPMMLKRVIASPVLEDTLKRVTGTKYVYSGSNNTAHDRFSDQAENTITGTKYEIYDWLNDGLIYFEFEGENELELLWRIKPNVMTYTEGKPDMLNQRIRMALGFGCPRPTTWMGVVATGTDNLP